MKKLLPLHPKTFLRPVFFATLSLLAIAACSSSDTASNDDDDDDPPGGTSGAAGAGGMATGGTGTPTGGASGTSGAGPTGGSGGAGSGSGGAMGGKGGSGGAPTGMNLWVAPNGVDTNPGTEQAPLLTLTRASTLARAGSTVWVMAGTFNYTATQELAQSGTAQAPIRLWAVEGARPALDYTNQVRASSARGIELTGNYWHIRGIEVRNAGDNGIAISGSNNTIENVITHHNGDTGIQITVSEGQATLATLGASNTVLNCDSYENFDEATNGENADGFAAKLRIGAGNVFRGCRAWNNADDGYDLFAADDVVVIENSWAFLNGRVAGGGNSAGDGNGFKLGGEPAGTGQGDAPHRVTGCAAFENRSCGFTRNNNAQSPVLMSCAVAGNGDDYCDDLAACTPESSVTVTGAEAKMLPRNADGTLPSID
jgi:hypothetical protein